MAREYRPIREIDMIDDGRQKPYLMALQEAVEQATGAGEGRTLGEKELRELAQGSPDKLSGEAFARLRERAIRENIPITFTTKDGTELTFKPAALCSNQENAVNDGDPQGNYYENKKQISRKEFERKLEKFERRAGKVVKGVKDTVANQIHRVDRSMEKSAQEFGR